MKIRNVNGLWRTEREVFSMSKEGLELDFYYSDLWLSTLLPEKQKEWERSSEHPKLDQILEWSC